MPIFSWTGNPFVDTGLMVILHFANKTEISELQSLFFGLQRIMQRDKKEVIQLKKVFFS